jgi:hypothetical protein
MNFDDEELLADIKSKFLIIFKNIKDNFKLKYDWVGEFTDDFAGVKLNNKWGFINDSGQEICEIKYDEVKNFNNFSNGFAIVKLNDEYLYIDKQGNEYNELPNKN